MSLSIKKQSNQVPAGNPGQGTWVRPSRLNIDLPFPTSLDSLNIVQMYQENTPLSRTIGPTLQAPIFPSRFGLPEKHFGFHPQQVQDCLSDVSSSSPLEESPSSPARISSDESPSHVNFENFRDISSSASQDVTNLNTSASQQPPVSPLLRNVTQKLNLPNYLAKSFENWLDHVNSPQVALHYTQLDEPNQTSSIGSTNPTQETSSDCDSPELDSPLDFRAETCYDSE
ncbi:MAG TPA: hypothetical protein VGO47_07785 [Chlamydiales bacterium]|nr:hypothetical protein [Chlamydiales bacterium]